MEIFKIRCETHGYAYERCVAVRSRVVLRREQAAERRDFPALIRASSDLFGLMMKGPQREVKLTVADRTFTRII